MPQPNGGGQILQRNDHTDKPVRFGRVVCRTHLENQLLLFAEVECLEMTAPTQIPNVHLMTVLAAEEQIWLEPVFDHVRRSPFAA